ncbi:MAG: hypothetical protein BVN35_22000 [Proteobacteria bacterium ST_bin11]|nr:MAG: hypothetical protein BVN35_22000 [Proteobacteria bacterium ST_bin11]
MALLGQLKKGGAQTLRFLSRSSTTNGDSSAKVFALPKDFVARYQHRESPFGFQGLGELVYRRTYSRQKEDGSGDEQWHETVERVVNGTFRLQQRWLQSQALPWHNANVMDTAQEMYDRIFELKFVPPGRGLWAMGSPLTEERHLYAALNNCAFTSTRDLAEDPIKPFTFLMDASMLGVGVGFDTLGANALHIPSKSEANIATIEYVVPDSREGWVHSLELLLKHYFYNAARPIFNFELVRPAGQIIRGFGGLSGGPEPLHELLTTVEQVLEARRGGTMGVTAIVDIMNMIGRCIVSGNVRRTAEIAFGPPSSEEFLNLKNYELNPQRASYGWTSNNSVTASLGMNYRPIVDRIFNNGEPGLVWLDNMRDYSRMIDAADGKDHRALGSNPCVEQTLESFELCCLVETFPARHSSQQDFMRTLELAFLYAKTVTLGPTRWPESNAVMMRNRRVGTSMSGIAQFIEKHGIEELRRWCTNGYAHLRREDQRLSENFGVPESIKITSVKPSGTVSLLAGATPGMHYPISTHYIRRVRLPANSPLVTPLRLAGYHIEPAVESEKTLVVEFPIDSGAKRSSDLSVWEQLSLASFLQRNWADNSVSCTVTFNPETEGPELLTKALDYHQYQLKGISFLPNLPKVYPQMPYEEIDENVYRQRSSTLRPIQWNSSLSNTEPKHYEFCEGDRCQLSN